MMNNEEIMQKLLNRHLVLIFILLSIIPLLDLFRPGLPITHDGQDHVARIANFYQSLQEGVIVPRWAGNLNWGYGHPILMFLYPLPSYAASFFHFLGFSFIDSTKIVFGLAYILSGITMYFWLKTFLGNIPGLVGGLFYLFAPYRFVDLYVRGAIGEHVAFVFPPLVCYFLLKLSKRFDYRYIVGGALSLAFLILSHNAITLMFFPLIFFYALFLTWESGFRKLFLASFGLLVFFGFGLSAFFWVPAFFEGKYTLRDIVTMGGYFNRFVEFKDFFYGQWNYGETGFFTMQVGIIQWAMIILGIPTTVFLYKKRNRLWAVMLASLFIFAITLFLMIAQSRFIWETITTLQKFQFPWRFLSVTVFTAAVIGGLVSSVIPKKKQLIFFCFLLIALLWFNKDYWRAKGYLYKPEGFFTSVYYGTTDTGESAPIWSVRFMEKEPKAHMEIIEGKGKVREIDRTSTKHVYDITLSERSRLRENTLYFPGWEVLVDGQKTSVEFQDPANRGLITFFVNQGKHRIELRFNETKLRFAADFISVVSFIILFFWGIITKRGLWRRFR